MSSGRPLLRGVSEADFIPCGKHFVGLLKIGGSYRAHYVNYFRILRCENIFESLNDVSFLPGVKLKIFLNKTHFRNYVFFKKILYYMYDPADRIIFILIAHHEKYQIFANTCKVC